MLDKLRRKTSKGLRTQEARRNVDLERERRLSYLRTQKATKRAKLIAASQEQSTKERLALEREWAAKRSGKAEAQRLRQAQLRRSLAPINTATNVVGKATIALGKAAIKGAVITNKSLAALSKHMREAEERERALKQRQQPTQAPKDFMSNKWY